MDIAIVGLPGSGKTSLFNALTRGAAEVGAYSSRLEPNLGVVPVPDERLDRLAEQEGSKRVTYAELRLADYPAAAFDAAGVDAQRLQDLAQMDALVLVARAFGNPAVPAPEGGVDADRDIEAMQLELTYADLALIERRIERIEPELARCPPASAGRSSRIRALLLHLREALEAGGALRALDLSAGERRLLARYQFATRGPLLILVNVEEDDCRGSRRSRRSTRRGTRRPASPWWRSARASRRSWRRWSRTRRPRSASNWACRSSRRSTA